MKKSEYIDNANAMLSDTNTYAIISDPTSRINRLNNNTVENLFKAGFIDYRTKHHLKTFKPIAPKIYFLPKHHKDNLPLRPVTSFIGSAVYSTSKHIADILGKLKKSLFNTKNSYEFCAYINDKFVPQNYMMVSFDVKSLFTSVPVE